MHIYIGYFRLLIGKTVPIYFDMKHTEGFVHLYINNSGHYYVLLIFIMITFVPFSQKPKAVAGGSNLSLWIVILIITVGTAGGLHFIIEQVRRVEEECMCVLM